MMGVAYGQGKQARTCPEPHLESRGPRSSSGHFKTHWAPSLLSTVCLWVPSNSLLWPGDGLSPSQMWGGAGCLPPGQAQGFSSLFLCQTQCSEWEVNAGWHQPGTGLVWAYRRQGRRADLEVLVGVEGDPGRACLLGQVREQGTKQLPQPSRPASGLSLTLS